MPIYVHTISLLSKKDFTDLSIAFGCKALTRFMFENGSKDVSVKDPHFLYVAILCGRPQIVQLLIDMGANIESTYYKNDRPLLFAMKFNKEEIVKVLIQNGADVNTKNQKGYTPLILASHYNQFEVVQILIDFGASIESRSLTGHTSLHYAAAYGRVQICKKLIENGADINVLCPFKETPLFYATLNDHKDIVLTLLDLEASLMNRNDRGDTILEYALRKRTNIFKIVFHHSNEYE